ncbi:carcinine hydrolase/isopenicillin-N N-acyltransferase family protein [Nanoarchaeota archaeon]
MCTTGWIKTKKGFIVFKNRDRLPDENINSNYFTNEGGVVFFGDRKFNGSWIGINKLGVAITHSFGPNRDVPEGYSQNENFLLNKTILEKAQSLDEATNLYKDLFIKEKIGKSYNVMICDGTKSNVFEFILDNYCMKESNDCALRSNHFHIMEDYNVDEKVVCRSKKRLLRMKSLLKNVESGQDLIPILKSHSENGKENICRHDYAVTVGSVIMELKDGLIEVHHILNKSPCEGDYVNETIKIQNVY